MHKGNLLSLRPASGCCPSDDAPPASVPPRCRRQGVLPSAPELPASAKYASKSWRIASPLPPTRSCSAWITFGEKVDSSFEFPPPAKSRIARKTAAWIGLAMKPSIPAFAHASDRSRWRYGDGHNLGWTMSSRRIIFGRLQSIHHRHLHVHQHQVVGSRLHGFGRLRGRCRRPSFCNPISRTSSSATIWFTGLILCQQQSQRGDCIAIGASGVGLVCLVNRSTSTARVRTLRIRAGYDVMLRAACSSICSECQRGAVLFNPPVR